MGGGGGSDLWAFHPPPHVFLNGIALTDFSSFFPQKVRFYLPNLANLFIRSTTACMYKHPFCLNWANFTMGPNEQNQDFAELRQKVCLYIHAVMLLRGLPGLDGINELFVGKKRKKLLAKSDRQTIGDRSDKRSGKWRWAQ